MKTDWDVVKSRLCCVCHYEHGFFSGLSCHREVSSISSHSWELKTSFYWAPGLTHLRTCWFSRTPHTDNQMFQHPHFQSGFLLCSIKWLTTYGFAIYACIYLFMHVCMCSFIYFTVVSHFLPFLTCRKAFRFKSRHEIKTDLITLLLTLLIWLCVIHQCILLHRKRPVFVIFHQSTIICSTSTIMWWCHQGLISLTPPSCNI